MFPCDLGLAYQEIRERISRLASHPLIRRETYDPSAVVLEDFPRYMQLNTYSCSVAATRAVLEYYGDHVTELEVGLLLGVNADDGADEKAVAKVLRRRARGVMIRRSLTRTDLVKQIDRGNPVIVCLDDESHWAVVYGYSRDGIYLMDSKPSRLLRSHISNRAFAQRWDGWSMIVS